MLEYVAIALLIVLATVIALIAIGLGYMFGPRKQSDVKAQPYESGISPFGEGTRRMPVRFYLIAVLFILFDIEVVFLYPWAVVYRDMLRDNGVLILTSVVTFLAILFVGYLYALRKGALDWER